MLPSRHPQHSEFIPKSSPHPTFPESSSVLETLQSRSHNPPLRHPTRFKDSNPKLEAPTIYHLWSPPTVCNSILPTFITCNAYFSEGNYGQWHISRHAIPPTSASNHDHYNKFNTCRLFSYKSLSTPPPRQHPCQVYTVLLLQGEGDCFPNPQSTHTTPPL